MADPLTEIREDLVFIKTTLTTINARFDSGAKKMEDHELRIRANTTDINNIAQNGRDLKEHLLEIKEDLNQIKPFAIFLQGFAKVAAVLAAIYTAYQFIPKVKG